MTEGATFQNEKSMCIRLWLEVGHNLEPRPLSPLGSALALDWKVWIRGINGQDISTFIQKVVFYLHPSSAFVYPKRVIQEPPYEIQESGCTSIEIPIHIYIKNSEKPNKIKLKYKLNLENCNENLTESNYVYYDFPNPNEVLKHNLLISGGEVIANTGVFSRHGGKLLVMLSDDEKRDKHEQIKKAYRFIEPIPFKKESKERRKKSKRDKSKTVDNTLNIDFKKILHKMEMTESEIEVVKEIFVAHESYEKSADPIKLPPMSDPIYQMPKLPLSLQSSLSSIELDYSMN